MSAANVKSYYKVNNVVLPKEGPVVVPVELDFSSESRIDIDGLLIIFSGKLSYIQGCYIDNADNANDLILTTETTKQRIIAPAGTQGYYNIFAAVPPNMIVETTPVVDLKIKIHFYNVPIMSEIWGGASGDSGDGLTDSELRAAPLEVERVALEYVDHSITNLSGADEELMPANADRQILIIANIGATPIGVNLTGGVATLAGAGSISVAAGGSITLDNSPPNGAINIIGTLNADVTAYEG